MMRFLLAMIFTTTQVAHSAEPWHGLSNQADMQELIKVYQKKNYVEKVLPQITHVYQSKADRMYIQRVQSRAEKPKSISVEDSGETILITANFRKITLSDFDRDAQSFKVNGKAIQLFEGESIEAVHRRILEALKEDFQENYRPVSIEASLFHLLIPQAHANAMTAAVLVFLFVAMFMVLPLAGKKLGQSRIEAYLGDTIQLCRMRDVSIPYEKSEVVQKIKEMNELGFRENSLKKISDCNSWAAEQMKKPDKPSELKEAHLAVWCTKIKTLEKCIADYKAKVPAPAPPSVDVETQSGQQ